MFDFLKEILGKAEPVIEKDEIASKEIEEYVSDLIKERTRDLGAHIEKVKKGIENGKKLAVQVLKRLDEAKLQNPDVPLKAKQFMEGNRVAYIRKVNLLINMLDIPDRLSDIPDFCKSYLGEIQSFLKSTQKSYHVLQEFFSHESGEVAHTVRGFEKIVKDLLGFIEESKLHRYNDLEGVVTEFRNHVELKKEAAKTILTMDISLKSHQKKEKAMQKEIDSMLRGKEYAEIKKKKARIIGIDKEVSRTEEEIDHEFAVIGKALKKYERVAIENNDLIKAYLDTPLKALLDDGGLVILDILESVKRALDRLGLADKKKAKTERILNKLTRERLDGWREQLIRLKNEASKIAHSLKDNEVNRLLVELHNKKEHLGKDIKECEKRIIDSSGIVDKEPELKDVIVRKVASLFKRELEII